jgi:hypothetical protein
MEVHPNHEEQDGVTLRDWVDPHELKKVDNIWYKDVRRVVTQNHANIIRAHHDAQVHRHPGIAQTIQLVERTHWWLGLRRQVTNYVKGCADCQRMKVNNRPT